MDKDLYNFTTELIDALNNTEDLYGFLFTVQTINAAGISIEIAYDIFTKKRRHL